MENLEGRKRLHIAEKAEIIFLVLQHIQHQQQVEARVGVFSNIPQSTVEPVIFTGSAQLDRLRSDIISTENAAGRHLQL